MPSIRSILKKLERKKLIDKEEINEIFKNLDGHDKAVRDKAIDEYMNKLCEHCMRQTNECHSLECPFCSDSCDIVNIAEKLKAGDQKCTALDATKKPK